MTPDETFWAYFAGFADGEGSFGIYSKSARFVISNTDRDVLEFLMRGCGWGRIIHSRKGDDRVQDCWQLELGSKAMREVLPRLIPHLRVKREVASLLYDYVRGIKPGANAPPSPEEVERRSKIVCRVREINSTTRSGGGSKLIWGNARGV